MNASSRIENSTNSAMNTAVRRTVVVRQSWANLFTDHVSGAAYGVEERVGVALVDLAAQPGHVDVDHVGLRIEVVVPDIFEQHGAGHHLAGILHQIFEQAELARLQQNTLAAALDLARQPVEAQIADLVAGRGFRWTRAPKEHLDAGEQLGEGIGLDEIVVATGPQAGDAVVDFAERRKNENGSLVALAAKRLDDGETVAPGQHAVDDQHVVVHAGGHGVAGFTVGGVMRHMSGFIQRLDQVAGRLAIVLDQKDLHDADPNIRFAACNKARPRSLAAPGPSSGGDLALALGQRQTDEADVAVALGLDQRRAAAGVLDRLDGVFEVLAGRDLLVVDLEDRVTDLEAL